MAREARKKPRARENVLKGALQKTRNFTEAIGANYFLEQTEPSRKRRRNFLSTLLIVVHRTRNPRTITRRRNLILVTVENDVSVADTLGQCQERCSTVFIETYCVCNRSKGYRVERNLASELTGEAEAEAEAKAGASFACRSCISVIPGNTLTEYPYRYPHTELCRAIPLASYFEVEQPDLLPSSAPHRSPVRSDAIAS
ncbi:hypothetical protein ANTRET_LOCUS9722 [Anthophora retusa]